MVKSFEEGETYRNKSLDKDIMVYAVSKETDTDVTLAVGFVDRESEEMSSTGELVVKKADFGNWDQLEIT